MTEYKVGDKVRVIGNGNRKDFTKNPAEYKETEYGICHNFKIGSVGVIYKMGGWGNGKSSVLIRKADMMQAVSISHIEHFTPLHVLLYRGIVGALFGPESHAVNRYNQEEEK